MNPSVQITPIVKVKSGVGNVVIIENELITLASTNLGQDYAYSGGVTTLAVDNTTDFTTSDIILVGAVGTETTEQRTLSSKTTFSLTVNSAVTNNHNKGEPVASIQYNQLEISRATTLTGTYSVLATVAFQWSQTTTEYQDASGLTTSYYKARFKNSVTSAFSDYSTPVSVSALTNKTAAGIIIPLKKLIGISSDDKVITDDWLLTALNEGRNILNDELYYGKANEWRHEFEYSIKMLAGRNYVALPDDIDFNETNRSLLNARYSRQSVSMTLPLTYLDKSAWNSLNYQNRMSFTTTEVAISGTSIVLENTGDFPSSGTIQVGTNTATETILSITYTANDLITNTLSGVTGVTRVLPVGTQIWAYYANSYPTYYTVYGGRIYFDRPIPTALQGKNIYIDYYKKLVDLVSLADELPEHFRGGYKNYLRFAIKRRRDDTIGEDDPDYQRFITFINGLKDNPYLGQNQILITN